MLSSWYGRSCLLPRLQHHQLQSSQHLLRLQTANHLQWSPPIKAQVADCSWLQWASHCCRPVQTNTTHGWVVLGIVGGWMRAMAIHPLTTPNHSNTNQTPTANLRNDLPQNKQPTHQRRPTTHFQPNPIHRHNTKPKKTILVATHCLVFPPTV